MDNPTLVRFCNEIFRPMAEQARDLLLTAQGNQSFVTMVTTIISDARLDDSEIIEMRIDGVPPITVGQLRAALSFMNDLVMGVARDERLPSVLAACVRPVKIS